MFKKGREEKMLWESQKMELMHKIKSLQRRVNDDDDRIKDMERQVGEYSAENQKMQLQMDEMRSIYRNKLIQFTADSVKGEGGKPVRMGYDLNAREELIRTYTEKEISLNEKLEQQHKENR
jgi:regulator of replication initiation timing